MKPIRMLCWAGVLAVFVGALVVAARPEQQSATRSSRAEHLAAELRCPVCQGLSVLDSDSPTARSIRQDIDRRIADGQTDAEVRQAYVDRFGQWILLRPRGDGFGVLVWLLPVAAAVVGVGGLTVALWRWRRRLAARASDEDRVLVQEALSRLAGGEP